MPDKKLTDNDKTKALECCISGDCDNCPYDEQTACNEYMKQDALDLINRQKEEIEAKHELIQCLIANVEDQKAEIEQLVKIKSPIVAKQLNAENINIAHIEAEAYKEFAERLKEAINIRPTYSKAQNEYVMFLIDNLLKELVGDADDKH